MIGIVLGMAGALAGAVAGAQTATPAPASMAGMDHAAPCPTVKAPPAEMAGWARKTPVRAGAAAAGAPLLSPGVAIVATLLPTPGVRYPLPPEKPAGAASSGGLFAFEVKTAGRYRVALGAGAWIDVVGGGKRIASVAHGHGPDCTGIRKMVDFDLRPGRYALQVAGNATPTLPLMVTRLP